MWDSFKILKPCFTLYYAVFEFAKSYLEVLGFCVWLEVSSLCFTTSSLVSSFFPVHFKIKKNCFVMFSKTSFLYFFKVSLFMFYV